MRRRIEITAFKQERIVSRGALAHCPVCRSHSELLTTAQPAIAQVGVHRICRWLRAECTARILLQALRENVLKKRGGNVMKKLVKLLPAVLLAAATLAPNQVAAQATSVVATINGGGPGNKGDGAGINRFLVGGKPLSHP